MGKLMLNGDVVGGGVSNARMTSFDNRENGFAADNVQAAIEEASKMGADPSITLTQEEYNALSDEEKMNGTTYFISDGEGVLPVNTVTKAQYEALGDSVLTDNVIYLITDEDYEVTAKNIGYDNSESELKATNVQEAIGEIKNNLNILKATLAANLTEITINDSRITENSIFAFYTSIYGVSPTAVTVTDGAVTLTFEAQSSDMEVGVRIDG